MIHTLTSNVGTHLLHCMRLLIMLTRPDLITASIYWSMIEVGLGFIATNLIVVYGLLARSSMRSGLRSLRSLLSLSKLSRTSSQETGNTFHIDEERHWPRENGNYSASAKHLIRDTDEIPLNNREIRL